MNHTPTPWFIKKGNRLNHLHGGNPDCSSLVVAGIEKEANAQFIVTACNAHEELVKALFDLRHAFFVEGNTKALKEAFAKTHELAKRLKGESHE